LACPLLELLETDRGRRAGGVVAAYPADRLRRLHPEASRRGGEDRSGEAVSGTLLTARQVAEMLGISIETVLRWAAAEKLPSVRMSSRAIRFRESAIEEWIAEHERGAAPREGVSHHGGRAQPGGYSGLLSTASAITPLTGGDNRGGS
jgi:excisionase family DNA binding protein